MRSSWPSTISFTLCSSYYPSNCATNFFWALRIVAADAASAAEEAAVVAMAAAESSAISSLPVLFFW